MDSDTKNKWQVRLAVVAIFAIGFIAGTLATNIYRDRARISYSSPEMMRGRFDRVLERLNLTPEQREQVRTIFDDSRAQLMEIRKQSEPRFREVRKQTEERLQAVLTPEQWEQYQEIVREPRGRRRHGGRERRNNKP
ncbi:MAG TPA: Spy/CpxP family protein refolding chaperone [Blastocatellia bacterium]|nr:Spy/CpxP family protein refolding chaperone [Blastocatellia bacterium]